MLINKLPGGGERRASHNPDIHLSSSDFNFISSLINISLPLLTAFIMLISLSGCKGCRGDKETEIPGDYDPEITDRIFIITGRVLSAENLVPIENARVFLDGANAVTDENGRFGFRARAANKPRAISVHFPGRLSAEKAVPPSENFRMELGSILLFMPDAVADIGPEGGTIRADDSGVVVTVPRNAFSSEVRLGIKRIPLGDPFMNRHYFPAEIPAPKRGFISPLFGLIIDSGAQPDKPVEVSVKAPYLPEGTIVPVGRFDTGGWIDAGLASAVNGNLVFQTSHFSAFAAALPALPADDTSAPELNLLQRSISPFMPGEPRLDPRSGAVQIGVPIPPLHIRGADIRPALFYDSRTIIPSIEIPVAATDAKSGEKLFSRIISPVETSDLEINVEDEMEGDYCPATIVKDSLFNNPEQFIVVNYPENPPQDEIVNGNDKRNKDDSGNQNGNGNGNLNGQNNEQVNQEEIIYSLTKQSPVTCGAYKSTVEMFRTGEAILAKSESLSFTVPEAGLALEDPEGNPVISPEPIEHRKIRELTTGVNNRSESSFGRGWHFSGLTRLIQPWCAKHQITLTGETDHPAIVFGETEESVIRPLSDLFAEENIETDDLYDARIAYSEGMVYIALPIREEVWKMETDASGLQLAAGGGTGISGEGKGSELRLKNLRTIAAGPYGRGILIATDNFITHLDSEANAKRLAGTGEDCEDDYQNNILPDVSALNSKFCSDINYTLAADPTSDRFLFSVAGEGTFDVSEGILRPLRTKESAGPHWHNAAFDHQGRLYYSADTGDCIYIYTDGLTDKEIFPLCLSDNQELLDGHADKAVAGGARAITFDRLGNLWFIDNRFNVLRRLSADNELVTVSGYAMGDPLDRLTPHGSFLGDTPLGFIESIAIPDPNVVFMSGREGENLVTTAPLVDGALVGMGSGDGSVLYKTEDSGYVRILETGIVEYYDLNGLLISRGGPYDAHVEYIYENSPESENDYEACGIPGNPPRLIRLELAGEVLWTFSYDASGLLSRVEDRAGRIVSIDRTVPDRDFFNLPCGAGISVSYNENGMITQKTSPGPDNNPDILTLEWENNSLRKIIMPTGLEREVISAIEQAVVDEELFDPLRKAVVNAEILESETITTSGEIAGITIGLKGIKVKSPAGDETEMETDRFGRLLRVTMPDGSSFILIRDIVGRIVEMRNEITGEGWFYRYVQHEGDLSVPFVDERIAERRDHRDRVTFFTYDTFGMLESIIDPLNFITGYRNIRAGAAKNLPERITDSMGRIHLVEYDRLGNMKRLTIKSGDEEDEERLITDIERDDTGRHLSVTSASGMTMRTEYDVWGEPILISRGNPSDGYSIIIQRVSTGAWTQYRPDIPSSAVLRAEDGEGRVWTQKWAPGWLLTESGGPAAGTRSDTTDEEGRVSRRDLADGSYETFTYDEAGRLLERRWLGPAFGEWASFTYEDDRIIEISGNNITETRSFMPGTGWNMVDILPSSDFHSRAGFRLEREKNFISGNTTISTGTSYFEAVRRFDDRIEKVRYRTRGQSFRDIITIDRNPAGLPIRIRRGNGTVTSIETDELGRIIRQEETGSDHSLTIEWTWDADIPSSSSMDGIRRDYSFDELNRLVLCGEESFSYNLSNELIRKGDYDYVFDDMGRLQSDGIYHYSYDELGRRLLRTGIEDTQDRVRYHYGPGGNLAFVFHGPENEETLIASYEYDSAGRRTARTVDEGVYIYGYYPDSDRPVRIVEPDDTEWFLYHAFSSAAWTVAVSTDGAYRYTHVDPFDRVIGISDENGNFYPVNTDCYGQLPEEHERSGPSIAFHGMHYDSETELYHAGARYYDPGTGTFLSPDPLGLKSAPAVYTYASGNPLMFQDPSGRFLEWVAAGAVVVGVCVWYGLRGLSKDEDLKKTRDSYNSMTDVVDGDDALDSAEQAHKRLHKSSQKAGEVAVDSVASSIQAVTNPASNACDVISGISSTASEMINSHGSREEYGDDDD